MAEKSNLHNQIDARADWEKFRITGNQADADKAYNSAVAAGFGGNEKSPLLANIPQLSKAFDEGRADAKTEWAIGRKEDAIHNLQTKYLTPEVGKSYQGPIVDVDGDKAFQSIKHEGKNALVVHQLKDLVSTKADTFAPSGKVIDIRYAAQGIGVGKEVKELGDRSLSHTPKGMGGLSR
ncbi:MULTISPECIES: KfrB domain-containing protein [Pseudomonas]|uniref:KfrB domain-containing protein n=1 Tax=Pseudomonas TaxID=286 RepID=UPI000996ED3B|nr:MULTISPECIES: hypothetical protein [Pseudomonas]OPA44968.1 hypothetical protein BZY58_27070 [Pseudomonas aeruginosa]